MGALVFGLASAGRLKPALTLILLLACSAQHVNRAHWQHMSVHEKTLYVRSLIGAEKVKERKGGNSRTFALSPGEYVHRIDDAYARGDERSADIIFDDMGSPR